MDDFVKILIWVIIIFFWVLRPLLKKKEPEKRTNYPKPKVESNNSSEPEIKEYKPGKVYQNQDDYDILKEIEKMFKNESEVPAESSKTTQGDPYDIYEPSEIKDVDLDLRVDKRMQREVQDKSPIGSRKTYDDDKLARKRAVELKKKFDVDVKTETEAKKFEMVLAGLDSKIISYNKFRTKLKKPDTIKEYILFSEILGKPKALRR